jgi:large subunit ribosomal protein L21
MMYAIIQLQGKQFKVQTGDEFDVDRLTSKPGDIIELNDVLMINTDGKVQIGTPLVKNAVVTLELLEEKRGEKIRVFKYKSKSRYRRTRGHRQELYRVAVKAIKV